MLNLERRIEALKSLLGDVEVTHNIDPNKYVIELEDIFSVGDEEYLVLTEKEAEFLAEEEAEQVLDEVGLAGLSPEAVEYALSECTNWDFEEAIEEDAYEYASGIEDEDDDEEYANRLVREAIEAGVIKESDCETDDEGKLYYTGDDLIDNFAEWYAEQKKADCPTAADYLEEIYGQNWAIECRKWLGNMVNTSALAAWVVEQDGAANSLARYDGVENEGTDSEGKTWYIYRVD